MLGDPLEQLIRSLNDDAVVARQIASAKHRKAIVGERRQHIRTVRSAAWSRNRPRPRLAWLVLLILLVLIALVARVDAAPEDDSIALAVRYADILTGVDRDDDDDDDMSDERADARGDAADPQADADGDLDGEADEGNADADTGTPEEDAEGAEDAEIAEIAGGADVAEVASFNAGDVESREQLAGGGEDSEAGSPGDRDDGGDGDDGSDSSSGAAGANPGQLAMLEAEQAPPGAGTGDDADPAAATAGAEETYESRMRHRRPSRWGRLDLGVAWRRGWTAPRHAPAHRSEELWLFATWRR